MVKLQKRFAYRYKGKQEETVHYKHTVTIPKDVVKKLGWVEGNEIQLDVKGDKLVLSLGSSRGKKSGAVNER